MTSPKTLSGRLTKDRFGASMPVDAPYYQAPPFYYRDAQSFAVIYETDAEAVADMLPEGAEVDVPALVVTTVVFYPHSTFGPCNEAILGVPCRFQGTPYLYVPHIVVDTVSPLAGGREIWGYPKKLAAISLEDDAELVRGTVERPRGLRILTATMRRERPAEAAGASGKGAGPRGAAEASRRQCMFCSNASRCRLRCGAVIPWQRLYIRFSLPTMSTSL